MTKQIATILEKILDPEHEWKYQLLRQWHDIFGPLSDKVRLEKIHKDTLILVVWNACWLHELYALSDVLLASINEKLDKPRIKKLRFKRGEQYAESKKRHADTPKTARPLRTINAKEQHALACVKDSALAEVLQSFLKRCIVNEGENRNVRTQNTHRDNSDNLHATNKCRKKCS